ncbi:MAG: 16S rRNA (guanine(966)-N(2))-methyltransferase RsmD, partial [Steroidobacteraceae bacterium]
VRETVFNWLQFELAGRRCLDMFAGSGALGLEALSRGAAEVVFVESDARAAGSIRSALQEWRAGDRGRVEAVDAFSFLRCGGTRPFDVVFLDPPYAERWLARGCEELERGGWLSADALVYLEDEAARGVPELPAGWAILRSKKAGEVGYHLARRGAGPAAPAHITNEGSA